MALQPGQAIGVYELIAPLGSGAMGEVFRARDTRLGRQVAIKFVSPRLHGHADAEARLDREARLASALNHPGIVTVYDVGRHEERPYVVMELIDGQSLAALIAESRLPIKEAVDVAAQIADALAAAHDAGIVHRDLKPHNILVTADGRAKVVDFGLSKMAPPASGTSETIAGDALTGNYAVLGTAGYMAPEQVMGLPADARSDQFALGAILYEILTGRRAFRRDTTVQTMSSILEDEPVPIAQSRPDVPATVVSIAGRCLAKRPERRYASTRDLAHDLRDAHEQLLLDGRSGPQVRRPPVSGWRSIAVAAVVLLAAVTAAWIWPRLSGSARSVTVAPGSLRYIVVMPFANVTKEAGDQVFADGLAETLTSTLTQLERYQRLLRVVPASEVRAARIESVRDARQTFGVTLAISGSIQRQPTRVRVTLNLVDAVKVVQLGSRTIDITLADNELTHETVVGAATDLLALELEPGERHAINAGGTSAPAAYELYVQGRGYLYRFDRGAENVDRAIDALDRAVAADARYALAHTALAEAYWRKYEATRDAVLIERAVRHGEQALAIDSRLAPVHITLALLARGRGRYEEAIVMAQRAVELDPVSSEAYRELGRAQEALNRFADAEATYRKAIEARPDDWQAYNTLGGFFAARSRWAEAEPAYQRVIELTPDNTRGYNNLGVAYFRLRREDDAAQMWERSMAIRPTFSAASNLGTYYFAHQRYTDAARAFERAVGLAPNDLRLWRNLGAALHWAPGERPKARAAFEKVVQLADAELKVNPRQPALLAQLGDAHSMLGAKSEAVAAATAVERLGVADAETAFILVGIYEQVGDRDAAFRWLAQARAKGYPLDTIERSPSLAEMRKDPRYKTLVDTPSNAKEQP